MKYPIFYTCLALLLFGLESSRTEAAEQYFHKQVCEYRIYQHPGVKDPDYEHPNGAENPEYFDSKTGILIDPVSGKINPLGGDLGIVKDKETGARFSTERGLWVDPINNRPVRSKRLNSFAYYDPKTNETINVISGERSPYAEALLTIGAQRQAADAIRWACLGDDLTQRVDPVTGRYLVRPNLSKIDSTNFDTFDNSPTSYQPKTFDGDRHPPSGFPRWRHFDDGVLAEGLNLEKGQDYDDVMAIMRKQLGTETAEGGGTYLIKEGRVYNNGLTVLITANRLMDDAVRAIQVMLFFDTSISNKTRLMNVGMRQVCGRPEQKLIDPWMLKRC